jgi:hypothetical protein
MDPIKIGQLSPEEVEQRDLNPVEVELYGYMLDTREEVSETFRFRPTVPAGAALDIMRHTGINGEIPLAQAINYLDKCLLEADVEPFATFLNRPDLMIEGEVIVAVYRALTEHYTARPTPRPSGSRSSGSPAKRTSRAAARSAASRSKSSRSS